MRKKLSLALAMSLVVISLSGCAVVEKFTGGDTGEVSQPSSSSGIEDNQLTVGVPEEDLNFGLEPESTPTFGEVSEPEQATQEETDDTLYAEKDGYLYRLDPATLEPVGEPLDPITKEPVDLTSEEEQAPTEQLPPVEEEEPESPSQEEPTEENTYPNTGIFLEDD